MSFYIYGLDEIDNKIISILMNDARLSYSEIGEQVGISRVAVKNRMDNLEDRGVITGYTAKINADALPTVRKFFIDICTEPAYFACVVDEIAKSEIITRVYAVSGATRLKAEGFVSSKKKYEELVKRVRGFDGIVSMIIQDALYTIKDLDGGVDYVTREDSVSEN